jgi:hypothetical protein
MLTGFVVEVTLRGWFLFHPHTTLITNPLEEFARDVGTNFPRASSHELSNENLTISLSPGSQFVAINQSVIGSAVRGY